MIREAVEEDFSQMLVMARQFHAASPFAKYSFDDERFKNTCGALIPGGSVFVAETNGTVNGMAAAVVGSLWFSDDVKIGQELFWWCPDGGQEAMALRQALEDWAKDQGTVLFDMVCLENEKTNVMARLYRREGYRPVERHFLKEL